MTKREVYLDNAATTICYNDVIDEMEKYLNHIYGNPSSAHLMGSEAGKILDTAKENILKLLGIPDNRKVIFTSGATESANLAISGTLEKVNNMDNINIIMSDIEHPAVSSTFDYYEKKGVTIRKAYVDNNGIIDIKRLKEIIDDKTKLVSFIYVNNEFGSVQNIAKLIKIIKEKNKKTLIHVDATQAMGKISCELGGADMISVSAHKLHGPKGTGALIIKDNIILLPQLTGGGQQDGIRSGTINTQGIAGMSKASEIAYEKLDENKKHFRDIFNYAVKKLSSLDYIKFNTPVANKNISYNILNISIQGVKGEVIVHMLEENRIYISTSSACSSGNKEHKSVLASLGLNKDEIESAVRISFSEETSCEDIDYFADKLDKAVSRIRKLKI